MCNCAFPHAVGELPQELGDNLGKKHLCRITLEKETFMQDDLGKRNIFAGQPRTKRTFCRLAGCPLSLCTRPLPLL